MQFFFGGNYVAWNKNKGNSVDFLVETPPLFFLAPFFFITLRGFFPLPSHLLMGGGVKTAQIGKKTKDCSPSGRAIMEKKLRFAKQRRS